MIHIIAELYYEQPSGYIDLSVYHTGLKLIDAADPNNWFNIDFDPNVVGKIPNCPADRVCVVSNRALRDPVYHRVIEGDYNGDFAAFRNELTRIATGSYNVSTNNCRRFSMRCLRYLRDDLHWEGMNTSLIREVLWRVINLNYYKAKFTVGVMALIPIEPVIPAAVFALGVGTLTYIFYQYLAELNGNEVIVMHPAERITQAEVNAVGYYFVVPMEVVEGSTEK